ncbi:MAG: hypothetical protein AAGH45_04290 [Pseudomonadota bacterium]
MRTLFKNFGYVMLLITATALGADLNEWSHSGYFAMTPLGEWLYKMDPSMLNTAQAVVQRYIAPWAWEYGIQYVLQTGTMIVAGIPAALCIGGAAMTKKKPLRGVAGLRGETYA